MSSGSAQDVAVEHFLRDIERRGKRLHGTVIGGERDGDCADMNLLYRKSRLDWRHRDSEGSKKSSGSKDPSATVGKVRDLASFRRHFRMGFLTMPASQDLSPRPCASAMAPRSQSCHSVGGGSGDDDGDLENGDFPSPQPSLASSACSHARRPPAKPKRHPSTRLSSPADPRSQTPCKEGPPSSHPPAPPPEKRSAMNKSDSVEMLGRKVPPLKPKRSPNTQLSYEPPPPRVPPPPTPLPRSIQDGPSHEEDGDEEPVYIEMVGQVFSRESHNATPHPATPGTPDSDSDQSEAIYEEMKYPVPEEPEAHRRAPLRHERLRSSKSSHSKPKATVSISHSSPLPSSSSSTPVPQALASSPQPPRAPTPYLLPGSKSQCESSSIPAPFPNLLQHRPPLLAFPQPAAASSGVGAQLKPSTSKSGSASVQGSASLPAPPSGTSKLPVLQSQGQQQEKASERKEAPLGPAPGLRARSHSTPLPPSSQSSHYSHYHHHQHTHHPPSHYHHYRRPDKELPTSHSMKLGSQSTAQTQTGKDGKSMAFLPKAEKREKAERDKDALTQTTPTTTPASTPTPTSAKSTPSPAPPLSSSSSSRSSSRPQLQHSSHSPHSLYHALPAYKPPPSTSPLLWTYPSVGLKRPPAYGSLRGGGPPHSPQLLPSGGNPVPRGSSAPPTQGKGGRASADDTSYWQRKVSFHHSGRDVDKEESRVWNGSTDALPRLDKDDSSTTAMTVLGLQSGIPVWSGGIVGGGGGAGESSGRTSETRGVGRSGLPLPCQTFPACHRNGELGRLGRSSSTSGVRQSSSSSSVHRQGSLPPRDSHNQVPPLAPGTPPLSQQQQLQLQYQQLAQLAQCHPAHGSSQPQRDGKLLEVIERKRCLCKEIKAHRRPDRSLCKQDSMPILPSWRRTPEPRKTGTPTCQQQAVLWDTAI